MEDYILTIGIIAFLKISDLHVYLDIPAKFRHKR